MKIAIHHWVFSLILAMFGAYLFANSMSDTSENTPSQTTTVHQTPAADAENTEHVTKELTFNRTALDSMLNSMQKQGKGEVIMQAKLTAPDKEQGFFESDPRYYSCDPIKPTPEPKPEPYNYNLAITPEIMGDGKIKLDVEFTFFDKINNTQQSKAFTKIVDDEQFILLDELIMPLPDKKDRLLLVFISPRAIYNDSGIKMLYE